nr:malonyl-CoA decarboxylase family protein [Azospirillum sp. B506]
MPHIKCYATLSPIPGFRRWFDRALDRNGDALLTNTEAERIAERLSELEQDDDGDASPEGGAGFDDSPLLARALARPGWVEDEELQKRLRGPLMRLGVHYLTTVQEAKANGRARALDPVAHFHLTNGARMERLNWLSDRSGKGLTQSLGMMINYRYRLGEIDTNHEAYTGEGRIIMSSTVRSLGRAGG